MGENVIKPGDYVIVTRQGYTKLHKMKEFGNLNLGSFNVKMDNCVGEKYFTTFQMKNTHNKRQYELEKVEEINAATNLNPEKSGSDNRNIINDGQSQTLTRDEIDKLKEQELSSNTIVEHLINNSRTFEMKTEFSQEKYIKKKEKKYFEYIQIRKPTIRLLAQMFYRQDPIKVLGIRIDDLSQILTYANIHSDGNHLLYDSGTSGLMTASIMNAIGANTAGKLIHMHPGNECQKNAFIAMQFPQEQTERCVNVNVYSVLRHFYQKNDEPATKKAKLDEKKQHWQIENEKACEVLNEKADSLIIVPKEHPLNIVKELMVFLKPGRNFVVFSTVKEPLMDLFLYLRSRTDVVAIKLSNSFLRNYQILPERTHPHVNMTTGGFILSATLLNNIVVH